MSANYKPVRLFYRHVNYSSTPVSRKKCEASLQHSLRISCSDDSVKKLEWNTKLSHHNLAIVRGQDVKLFELTENQRWNLLYDISPEPRAKNHSKLKTQGRQYRAKLINAMESEFKQGNERSALFILSILNNKGFISPFEVSRAEKLTMTRPKQRINALKKYIAAHNTFFDKPSSEKSTYIQEGIFKIPGQWGIGSDIISLQEYMRFTERFLLHHFPHHPIQLIVGHDDERLENENTGLHTHYFLGGRNLATGEYDLRLREIELVNNHLKSQGRENELLPDDGKLNRYQTKVLGRCFQEIVQAYTNKWLLNPKGYHAEFSDEAEKRTVQYQNMVRQAKLPKSQRDYNYQSRIVDSLKLDIQVLREEKIKESNQLNALKSVQAAQVEENKHQYERYLNQINRMEDKLQKLHIYVDSTEEELEYMERQLRQNQLKLQKVTQHFIHMEELYTEKKSELQKLDTLMKEQIKEILLDSYMLMQARHRKHDAAARKYAHRISERLNGDIPAQLRPLLDAAMKESGYSPPKGNEFDS